MSFRTLQGPLLLAALCTILVVAVYQVLAMPLSAGPFLLIAFFTVLSLAGRFVFNRARDAKQAVRTSMSVMALKMFASLIVLLIVIFATPRDRVLLMALTFGALYLVYLVFDTAHQFRSVART